MQTNVEQKMTTPRMQISFHLLLCGRFVKSLAIFGKHQYGCAIQCFEHCVQQRLISQYT